MIYARLSSILMEAWRLCHLTAGIFVLGVLLVMAGNQQVDGRIWAWHALWHILGACGLLTLRAFNRVRFGTGREA